MEGYVATIQTKSCFVFQLNKDVKSASVNCEISASMALLKTTNRLQGQILFERIQLSSPSSSSDDL